MLLSKSTYGNMTTLLSVRAGLPFLKIGQTRNIGTRWASSKVTTRSSKLRKQDFEYCVDLVQNRDREGYLCGLLMPYQSRRSYFAIRAFNVELASIKDGSVSRQVGGAQFEESGATMALKVRVQWWRDAISQIYGDDKSSSSNDDDGILASMASSSWNNPVVRVLDHAVHESNLTRRFLERLLEMREDDLDVKQLDSLTDSIAYAEGTFSSLFYLSLETVNVREEASDMVAYHAGIGLGLVTALRAARFRFARGECTIPKELIPPEFPYYKFNVENPKSDFSDVERDLLKQAVCEMATVASSHLMEVRERQSGVPKHARPCFLPLVPALHFLDKLQRVDYNIFDDSLLEPDRLRVLLLLGRSWITGVL